MYLFLGHGSFLLFILLKLFPEVATLHICCLFSGSTAAIEPSFTEVVEFVYIFISTFMVTMLLSYIYLQWYEKES